MDNEKPLTLEEADNLAKMLVEGLRDVVYEHVDHETGMNIISDTVQRFQEIFKDYNNGQRV
jgi:hypothetical protein